MRPTSFYLPVISIIAVCIAIAGHFESSATGQALQSARSAASAPQGRSFECKLDSHDYPTCSRIE